MTPPTEHKLEQPQHIDDLAANTEKHQIDLIEYAHQDVDRDGSILKPSLHEGQDEVQLKSALDQMGFFQALRAYRRTIAICAIAGFCAVTDGFQNAIASSIVSNAGFLKQFGALNAKGKYTLEPMHVSTYGGLFSTGQVIGQTSIGFVAEGFGRKSAMYTFTLILTIATIVEVVSKQWWHWTIAKFIAGVGVGAVQATLPVFINEHAPSQLRGFLIVAYSLWFSLGDLIASITLKVLSGTSPLDWHTPIYIEFGMIGFALVIFFFLPESPWWLISKGKVEPARKILTMKYQNVAGYDIETELNIMAATIEKQREFDIESKSQGYFAMFKGLNGKRFLISSWPKVLQQFVGLSVFSNYSTYFFQLAVPTINPFTITIILRCVSLLSVTFDAALVDKIGRRRMTLIGFGGACAGMLLMAIVGSVNYDTKALGAVLVFAGVIANFFNTFQSSTSYAYLTELPEIRFRSRSTGLGLAYCNLYAIIFAYTVPLMIKVWQVKTAWLFVCLGIPGTVLAYFIMPETMQRSPAEIQELFVTGVSLRKWRGHKTAIEEDLDAKMRSEI